MAILWVGSACAGWLPGAWAVLAQSWWWLLVSLIVSAAALSVPRRLSLRWSSVGMTALLVGVLGWLHRMPGTLVWVAQPFVKAIAGVLLVERWGWLPLRRAVVWWAWVQVAWWPMSWIGLAPYAGGWTGTLGSRHVLAIWLMLASMWSSRWRAWGLALASLATGSVTGLPALLRLLGLRWWLPMTWLQVTGVAVLSSRWWWPKLSARWEVWTQAIALLPTHWVTGWGLQQLPVRFQEAAWSAQMGSRWAPGGDLHNTWLDVAVRGGTLGSLALLVVMAWAWWRSEETGTIWTWAAACWVMTWQSVGASPALWCLAMVWLLSLCAARRMDADPVS